MGPERVELKFFGQTYYLAGDRELEEVVEYAERLANNIQARHPDLPVHRLVVLMVLELIEQLLELRRGFKGYKQGVEGEARRMAERIDEILRSVEDID